MWIYNEIKKESSKRKWNNVIYSGNYISAFTKLPSETEIKIAFKAYTTMKTYTTKHQQLINQKLSVPCLDCKNVCAEKNNICFMSDTKDEKETGMYDDEMYP
jgi:hypothetical protein